MRLLESPRLLFWVPTLIWASTWHVILYQLAEAPPLNSVGWRFLLAGLVLLGVAIARGEPWRLELRWHAWVLLTGVVQYSVNYWGVYEAERHIPSGLVAVLFSLMVFGNALNITPVLLVPNLLIYQCHDGAMQAVDAVYDRGVPLTAAGDVANYAALAAASVSPGRSASSCWGPVCSSWHRAQMRPSQLPASRAVDRRTGFCSFLLRFTHRPIVSRAMPG